MGVGGNEVVKKRIYLVNGEEGGSMGVDDGGVVKRVGILGKNRLCEEGV